MKVSWMTGNLHAADAAGYGESFLMSHSYCNKVNPPGVYYIHRCSRSTQLSGKRKSKTLNFYLVRIPTEKNPGVTTICKCDTREEAESAFLNACPDHKGGIPYFEVGDYLLKRKRKMIDLPKVCK